MKQATKKLLTTGLLALTATPLLAEVNIYSS
ncbi:MAG: hypothetical protein ACI9S6_003432, partial [Reinekea sp.]